MTRPPHLAAAALSVLLLTLAACSTENSSDPPDQRPAPTPRVSGTPTTTPPATRPSAPPAAAPPAAGQLLWTYDEQRPAAEFDQVDGVLVGLTLRKRLLRITALDPGNGSVLWDYAASPGWVAPGVAPTFLVLGKNVAFLRPTGSDRGGHFWTTIDVVAAKTGKTVASSDDSYLVDGLPSRCGRKIVSKAEVRLDPNRRST